MKKHRLAVVCTAALALTLLQATLYLSADTDPETAAPDSVVVTWGGPKAAGQTSHFKISNKPMKRANVPAENSALYGSPYVTDVTGSTAVVNWVLKTPAGDAVKVDRVSLSKLKPSTTYYYDVLQNGTIEGRGQFSTPPKNRADFKFVVYGDTRTRNDVHRKVVEKISDENPVFVVHNGDLVENGNKVTLWPTFFSISEPLLRHTVFFPMLGNHERNTAYFKELFPTAPVHYSFTWGGIHFSIMNSDVNNVAKTRDEREAFWHQQVAWLENDLSSASSADFRFVAMHHTPFTAMKNRQADAAIVAEHLMPVFEKYNVQAVFSGHDHNYQHHRSNGIEFLVSGGGGAPLYDCDAPIPGVTVMTQKTENYIRGRVNGRECMLEVIALDGRTLDTISLAATSKNAAARTAAAAAKN